MTAGHCDCGERCSCGLDTERRAKCTCWHEATEKPVKVFGLIAFEKTQESLIQKHCFGDCGKVSAAGAIIDDMLGPLWVCCETVCPWLRKEMDEPFGRTNSFGRPHEVYIRILTGTPGDAA